MNTIIPIFSKALFVSIVIKRCARTSCSHNLTRKIGRRIQTFSRVVSKKPSLYDYSTATTSQLMTIKSSDGFPSNDTNHMKSYHITGSGQKSFVQMKTDTGHSLLTDVPTKMGGGNQAPQPVETLLSALLGCTQATAMFVGRQMKPRLLIERMEYDVSAQRDERGAIQLPIDELPEYPARLQHVSGVIRVFARKGIISQDELNILEAQTEARCPVAHMMISSGCKMNIKWVDGSK